MISPTATTSYGNLLNFTPALTFTQAIGDALGDAVHEFDIDAIAVDLRAAIDAALPDGVSIHGDSGELYGPYTDRHQVIDYPGIWADLDFWGITFRHELAAA